MADLSVSFEIYDEEAVKVLQEEDPDLLPSYSVNAGKDLTYNKKQVTNAITSGIIKGESIPKIASNLQSTMKNLNQNSAIGAARTAATSAHNAGKLSAMKELAAMGVEVQKEWVATLDDRTRESHRKLDGERRDLDERFSNGLMYPGASGSSKETWRCRCTMASYIPEYDSNDEPRQTYSEWEENKQAAGSVNKANTATAERMQKRLKQYGNYIYDYEETTKKLTVIDKRTGSATVLDYESGKMIMKRNGQLRESRLSETTYNRFFDQMQQGTTLDIDVAGKSNVGGTLLSLNDTISKMDEIYKSGACKDALGKFVQDGGQELRAITNKAIGYDALPTVVSTEEFSKKSAGKAVLYRGQNDSNGVTAAYCKWQYQNSNLWTGNSGGAVYGNGTYFGGDSSIADSYGTGSTIKAVIKDGANIAAYETIYKEYSLARDNLIQKSGEAINKSFANYSDEKKREKYKAEYDSIMDEMKIIDDVGSYAKIKGYDAIYESRMDYYVILNRGALIVEE